jgi:hypothetical protein
MRHVTFASSFVSLLGISMGLLAGCSYGPLQPLPMDSGVQNGIEHKDLPVTVNSNIDLLFLIDDSPSMGDKQTNLAVGFPKFIDVLNTIPGGLPSVHIGVVTSDLGTKGAGDASPGPGLGTLGQGGCAGLGKAGNLQLFGAPVSGASYISDVPSPAMDGSRTKNYMGNLSDVFSKMAKAGAGGCGFEQHLEAMKQALNNNPANTGFLRPDAYLAVIFIADEDDCSMSHSTLLGPEDATLGPQQSFRCTRFGVLCDDGGATTDDMNTIGPKGKCHPNDNSPYLTKVSDYVRFVQGLKTDPNNVIVAGILGTTDPFEIELRAPPPTSTVIPALAHSCTYVGGDGIEVADPAIRLRSFLEQFQYQNAFSTICDRDLSSGLDQIGLLLKTVLVGDPCIEGKLADVDPKTDGAQYECAVSAITDRGEPTQAEVVLPKCTPESALATNQPCWHLTTDPATCPNSDHIMVKIEGKGMLSSRTHVIANCTTAPN